jgi:hypothetical protein
MFDRFFTSVKDLSEKGNTVIDKDRPHIIRDKDGNTISDDFYARSEQEALRIAQFVYPNAVTAEVKTYIKGKTYKRGSDA